jgi:hypothetical protein
MKLVFRIEGKLLDRIRADLRRPHPFAHERVGFISAKAGALPADGLTIMAVDYHPVADDHYLDDPRVGAMMGSAAISKALEIAYRTNSSMFHVHLHEHAGTPQFSPTDTSENAKFVPDFSRSHRECRTVRLYGVTIAPPATVGCPRPGGPSRSPTWSRSARPYGSDGGRNEGVLASKLSRT